MKSWNNIGSEFTSLSFVDHKKNTILLLHPFEAENKELSVADTVSQNNILITNLNMKVIVKIYLYGDPSFKVSENLLILPATI